MPLMNSEISRYRTLVYTLIVLLLLLTACLFMIYYSSQLALSGKASLSPENNTVTGRVIDILAERGDTINLSDLES